MIQLTEIEVERIVSYVDLPIGLLRKVVRDNYVPPGTRVTRWWSRGKLIRAAIIEHERFAE